MTAPRSWLLRLCLAQAARLGAFVTIASAAACGGNVQDGAEPGGAASSDAAAALSFAYGGTICMPECPESTPVLAGARVLLLANGLPLNARFHVRSLAPEIVEVEKSQTECTCKRTVDERTTTTRRIEPGSQFCEADEIARCTQHAMLLPRSEGDAVVELLDAADNVVDATIVRSRVPTILVADVRLRPRALGDLGAAPVRAADQGVELPLGDALFVTPIARRDGDELAFYDGVAFSASPYGVLVHERIGPRGEGAKNGSVVPGPGKAMVRAAAVGDGLITVAVGAMEHRVVVHVRP